MTEQEPLFELDPATGNTQISLSECSQCGHSVFPPVLLGCEGCGALPTYLREKRVAAAGHVLASALVSDPNGTSFTVASIKLDDGPAIRAIVDMPANIGCPVRGEIVSTDESYSLVFKTLK